MTNASRYLITTADERTWKFDRPVIFLGEWCRLYNRKHVWQDMDAIVAEPYGLGLAKKDADYAEARALEDRIFPKLCAVLNQHHGTQHGERFWRIVLGHWFRRIVDVLVNRVKTLEQCLRTHEISGFTTYDNENYSLATPDSYSAIWAFNDDRWNNALDASIINTLCFGDFPIDIIPVSFESNGPSGFRFKALATSSGVSRIFLDFGRLVVSKISGYMMRDTDAFIINSYLPRKEALKLAIALRQWPQIWSSPKVDVKQSVNIALRKRITNQLTNKEENNIENILKVKFFEMLPVCYFEGFNDLKSSVKQQKWPKDPKFIWTCNSFDTDEVFKLWAASKAESGIKYFTGQHGNNYGTHRYMYPSVEESTSDKFLTWGWMDGLPQHVPSFIFKTAGKKHGKYNRRGGLLLIELCLNHRITTWDGVNEFIDYFDDQNKFINQLACSPKQQLSIRLHAGYRYLTWNEDARWHAINPKLKIDIGGTSIHDLIGDSRLIVHSYDSTGILETLSQNIPTLAFWRNDFDHLREISKPYYQLLVNAGIVHLTPESVASKVNEVWDDVDGWWSQSTVQDARIKFCQIYARTSVNPVRELKKIFSNQSH
jgi:putative transferase (TIGR04331 family)